MNEMIQELQMDYLDSLGLKIEVNPDYVFSGSKSRWLAVYEKSSRKIENGIVSIGINYPHMYKEMCKRGTDKDRFNIEAQARITIGHEIGHGLIDYIRGLDKEMVKNSINVKSVVKCGSKKEEEIVEEFGEWLFPEATDVYDSILVDTLEEI